MINKPQELLLNSSFIEYQREIERKRRLESKAIFYVIIVSIIMTVSVLLGIFIYPNIVSSRITQFIYFSFFLCTVYFSILTLVVALKTIKLRSLYNMPITEIEELWESDMDVVSKTLFNTMNLAVTDNTVLNEKLAGILSLVYIFLCLAVTSFILQLILSFLFFIGVV